MINLADDSPTFQQKCDHFRLVFIIDYRYVYDRHRVYDRSSSELGVHELHSPATPETGRHYHYSLPVNQISESNEEFSSNSLLLDVSLEGVYR